MVPTDGSLPQQLGVVWSRLLEADSEGPSFISHAACARSVSSSRTFLSCACGALSIVHIGGLSTTQAAILSSQTLDPIQYVPEQALRCAAPVTENRDQPHRARSQLRGVARSVKAAIA